MTAPMAPMAPATPTAPAAPPVPTESPGGAFRLDGPVALTRLYGFILLGSLLLTLGAWAFARHALEQRNRVRFERQAEGVIEELAVTLERQAGLLRAAAGFVEAGGDDASPAWAAFTDALDLDARYPALGGLAVVRRVPREAMPALVAERRRDGEPFDLRPAHDAPVHLPIVMVADAARAAPMLGYDLAFEPHRRAAIDAATTDDAVRLTAPVHPGRGVAAGTVMVAPYGSADGGVGSGVVATSMFFDRLFADALAADAREVRLRIVDAGDTLLDEIAPGASTGVDPAPLLETTRPLAAHGRRWEVHLETTLGFRADADTATPWIVLGSGLTIDLLLAALLGVHLRGARRLHAEREALERSNEKLETFACVVTHDLKAPMLGIGALVDGLEEDLVDGLPAAELQPTFARVRGKLDRADAIIDGVLEYCGVGEREERSGPVDVRALIGDVGESLDLAPGALTVDGASPTIETVELRLRQVLANLIGNAFKYHDAPQRARVHVHVERGEEALRLTVRDDGPGIPAELRHRIFEPFFSAHGPERTDSTGVGLAIVKKGVEVTGGTIELLPSEGRGATFRFSWPAQELDAGSVRPTGPDGAARAAGIDRAAGSGPGLRLAA